MKGFHFYLCFTGVFLSSCASPKSSQSMLDPQILNGAWEVFEITTSQGGLYTLDPERKPSIVFDVSNQKITGTTGCNKFNGPFTVTGSKIDFTSPLGMTRMMCPGDGESIFISTLEKVNGWTVREEVLRLFSGDLVVMKLNKSAH